MPVPSGRSRRPTTIPPEALLAGDDDSFWRDALQVGATVFGTPQHLVLSALAGEIPFTEQAPWSFEELMELYGVATGDPLTEGQGQFAKTAIWGTAGAAVGGPIGAAIFGGLSFIGDPPRHVRGAVSEIGTLATDPLMYFRGGKILGRGRAPAEASRHGEYLGHAFTKGGTRKYNVLRKDILPSLEGLPQEEALQLASEQATHALIAGAGGVKSAQKAGLLQKGGLGFFIPGTDVGTVIPRTPEMLAAMGKGVRAMTPEPIRRAFGIYGPEQKDVITTFHQASRETAARSRVAMNRLARSIDDTGLSPEYQSKIYQILQHEEAYGLDDAVARFSPGATADDVLKIRKVVDATRKEFSEARAFANARGQDISRLDIDELERQIARKRTALAQVKKKESSRITGQAARKAEKIAEQLEKMTETRRALTAEGQSGVHELLAPVMKQVIDKLRRGVPAAEVSRLMRQQTTALRKGIPEAIEGTQRQMIRLDERIARMRGAHEGLTEETQSALQRIHSGEDAAAGLSKDLEALHWQRGQTPGYFPIQFDSEGRRILREMAADPEKARRMLDVDIPAYFGDKTRRTTDFVSQEIELKKFARRLVQSGIEEERVGGFRPRSPRRKTPHARQRGVKLDVLRLPTAEEAARGLGAQKTGYERALRAEEMNPVIEGLEHIMGEKWSKNRLVKMVRGEANGVGRLKLKTPSYFAKDPVSAIARYYQKLGVPIGVTAAIDDVGKRFGRFLQKDGLEALQDGGMPGWVLMDDIPGMGGNVGAQGEIYKRPLALPFDVAWDFRRWYRNVANPEMLYKTIAPYLWAIDWWKQMALAVPAFHARNYQSGIWQSMAIGGMANPLNFKHGLFALFRRGDFGLWGKNGEVMVRRGLMGRKTIGLPWSGEKLSYDDLLNLGQRYGIEGPSFWEFEHGMATPDMGPKSITRLDRTLFRANAWIGNNVELALRYGQFADALKQGFSPREASKIVGKTHFLYESLTPFEQAIRKTLFPFYAWSRFNIPATIESAMKNPGLYRLAQQVADSIQHEEDMPASPALVPQWVRANMGIHLGLDENGDDTYFLLGNFWPGTDVLQMAGGPVEEILSQLTPGLRVPYEMVTGQVAGSQWTIEKYPGEMGRFLGVPMEKSTIQLLRSLRWLNEADRLVGPMGEKQETETVADWRRRLIHSLLGHKVYVVDREKTARGVVYRNEMEIRRMRGLYARYYADDDIRNQEVILRWLSERGLPPPSEAYMREYLRRRDQSRGRLDRRTQEVLQTQP